MTGPSVVASERSGGGVPAGGRLTDAHTRRINARMITPTTSRMIHRILCSPDHRILEKRLLYPIRMIWAEHLQVNRKLFR
jgi:hypothetical protein